MIRRRVIWGGGHTPSPHPQPPSAPPPQHNDTPFDPTVAGSAGASVNGLPLDVSWFDTGMPKGPALGDPKRMTWHNFTEVLRSRREGVKDGPGFIPARFKLEPNGKQVRRVGSNLIARTLVVLDIETDKRNGEVPPSPDDAAGRIRKAGWAAVVYTSHNHSAAAPRYRVVVLLAEEIDPELPAVEVVADTLGLAGVFDRSKTGANSLFYCPSAEPGERDRHQTMITDGAPIATAWIRETAGKLLAERRAEQERIAAEAREQAERRRQAKIAAGYNLDDSLIEKIRAHLDLEQILLSHGYEKSGQNFRHPGSTSGQFGADIKVIGGIERVYSFNASDPLYRDNLPAWCGGVTAIDAVDVITILEFGCDRTKALRELAERYGLTRTRDCDPGKGNSEGPPPPPPPVVEDEADGEDVPKPGMEGVALDDFRAYMPMHQYIFMPSRDLWPSSSVNTRLKPIVIGEKDGKPVTIPAGLWLDQNRPIEQMTWAPGLPEIIENRLIIEGGWIKRKDVACFNLYLPPTLSLGDPSKAIPWLDHVRLVYPDDAEHILPWLAHRVQRPQEKTNHALILSGPPGIGKDTLLEPVKRAIGPWNFREASPTQVLGRFNGFLKGVILRISEIKDLGETDRYAFYEHMKAITAAPPDVLRCDEKHIREHAILNVCGVVYTTNYKAEGLYLPADDRRHYVAWSRLTKEDFTEAYWSKLWAFLDNGGDSHVAAYLAQHDLSSFNPKAPPPKTDAFWDIVNAHRPSETAELADALDSLGNPDAVTLRQITSHHDISTDFSDWLKDRKNRTKIPHRFEECGYTPVRNPDADDGLWHVRKKREVVYSKTAYSVQTRIAAAEKLRDPPSRRG